MQPVLFLGHGSPLLAITDNPWRSAWLALGKRLPRPSAVLCVSAHWETPSTRICSADPPETLHDFRGFPPALHAQHYPAPGAPQLIEQVQALAPHVVATPQWGLDHGAWCVLQSLFPDATVPVAQLSLAADWGPREHLQLGRQLAALRAQDVLIVASGNGVHNLRTAGPGAPWPWALEFDRWLDAQVRQRNETALLTLDHPAAAQAVPTAEHYLPLLYAFGASRPDDELETVTEGVDLQSIGMRSWAWWPGR